MVPDPLTKDIVIRIYNLYYDGLTYNTIAKLFNEEKVCDKTNWKDTSILKIISNVVYKGDYIQGKTTKNPRYFENVVEPIVSKELWEKCQVQKKKNQRNYMRSQTYIFLQKLKCPKCGRILAGGASHKIKSDKWYYYYRCEKCRGNIREHEIETSIKEILSDIFEYDSVVNEFFLPVLQNKIHNPKEYYEKEITNLNNKKVRIRKAYIDELFTEEEYKEETSIIENKIKNLEKKLLENEHLKSMNYQYKTRYNDLKEKNDYLIYHLNKIIKKLPEFIQNIIDRLFNQCNIDLKFFKQQYDPEVKEKERKIFESRRISNLFNKKEINKSLKHINDEMDNSAEEFYSNKKEKDDGLSL